MAELVARSLHDMVELNLNEFILKFSIIINVTDVLGQSLCVPKVCPPFRCG